MCSTLVFAASFGFNTIVPAVPRAEFRRVYSLDPEGRVAIRNFLRERADHGVGPQRRRGEGDQERARKPGGMDDARVVVDPASPNLLSICTQYGGADAEHPANVEYQITVPRRARLERSS